MDKEVRDCIPDLKRLIEEYLSIIDDEDKDEWYATDRAFHRCGLDGFVDWLGKKDA